MAFKNLIFDMDGTLWDAVDSYAEIWNVTNRQLGIDTSITRHDLVPMMGLSLDIIFSTLFPDGKVAPDAYLPVLAENEEKMMPVLGGILYPGVKEEIPYLAEKFGLYMVSNCGRKGLENFLNFTGLRPFFNDTLTQGETGLPKSENIKNLIARNSLDGCVYVGDTATDCIAAHEAGIPMILMEYGFGDTPDADFRAADFKKLIDLCLQN